MHYLVDGYNVTKADPATRATSLEEQREALVARLRTRGTSLLGAGRILIVFDGGEGEGVSAVQGVAPVEVRFSRGESADDLIVRVARASNGSVCIVSSDSDLAERVRAGAGPGVRVEVRGRESVFEAAQGTSGARRKGRRYPAGSVGIPAGGNRITEELKALWLKGDAEENEE